MPQSITAVGNILKEQRADIEQKLTAQGERISKLTAELQALDGKHEHGISGVEARLSTALESARKEMAALQSKLAELPEPPAPYDDADLRADIEAKLAALVEERTAAEEERAEDTLTRIADINHRIEALSQKLRELPEPPAPYDDTEVHKRIFDQQDLIADLEARLNASSEADAQALAELSTAIEQAKQALEDLRAQVPAPYDDAGVLKALEAHAGQIVDQDADIEALKEHVEDLREKLRKAEGQSDADVEALQTDIAKNLELIEHLTGRIEDLPEPKYYDLDINALREHIEDLQKQIKIQHAEGLGVLAADFHNTLDERLEKARSELLVKVAEFEDAIAGQDQALSELVESVIKLEEHGVTGHDLEQIRLDIKTLAEQIGKARDDVSERAAALNEEGLAVTFERITALAKRCEALEVLPLGKDGKDGLLAPTGLVSTPRHGLLGSTGKALSSSTPWASSPGPSGTPTPSRATGRTGSASARLGWNCVASSGKEPTTRMATSTSTPAPRSSGGKARDACSSSEARTGKTGSTADPGKDGRDGADGPKPIEIRAIGGTLAFAWDDGTVLDVPVDEVRTLLKGLMDEWWTAQQEDVDGTPLIAFRGQWLSKNSYRRGDVVLANSTTWICYKPIGANSGFSFENWAKLAGGAGGGSVGGGSKAGLRIPKDQSYFQLLSWNPGTSNIIDPGVWVDGRELQGIVDTVADLSDRKKLPQTSLIAGKLVYVKSEKMLYEYIADPTSISNTITDWQPLVSGVTYVGRSGNLPLDAVHGQMFVIRMDVSGNDYYRLVSWDETIAVASSWEPLSALGTTFFPASLTQPVVAPDEFTVTFNLPAGAQIGQEGTYGFRLSWEEDGVPATQSIVVDVHPGMSARDIATHLEAAFVTYLPNNEITATQNGVTLILSPKAGTQPVAPVRDIGPFTAAGDLPATPVVGDWGEVTNPLMHGTTPVPAGSVMFYVGSKGGWVITRPSVTGGITFDVQPGGNPLLFGATAEMNGAPDMALFEGTNSYAAGNYILVEATYTFPAPDPTYPLMGSLTGVSVDAGDLLVNTDNGSNWYVAKLNTQDNNEIRSAFATAESNGAPETVSVAGTLTPAQTPPADWQEPGTTPHHVELTRCRRSINADWSCSDPCRRRLAVSQSGGMAEEPQVRPGSNI